MADELQISRFPGQYWLDPVQEAHEGAPIATAGLIGNRIPDEPPAALVDTESMLRNQYDILSKAGYVHRPHDAASTDYGVELLRATRDPPPTELHRVAAAPPSFFEPIDDCPRRACEDRLSRPHGCRPTIPAATVAALRVRQPHGGEG